MVRTIKRPVGLRDHINIIIRAFTRPGQGWPYKARPPRVVQLYLLIYSGYLSGSFPACIVSNRPELSAKTDTITVKWRCVISWFLLSDSCFYRHIWPRANVRLRWLDFKIISWREPPLPPLSAPRPPPPPATALSAKCSHTVLFLFTYDHVSSRPGRAELTSTV